MLNSVQHIRLLNILRDAFEKRASWDKKSAAWLEGFYTLSDSEQEELLTQFCRSQADTITKKMNNLTSIIHVPHLGNFSISAQQAYCYVHREALKEYSYPDKRDLVRRIFGTLKPIIYSKSRHEKQLSIKPPPAERKTDIF